MKPRSQSLATRKINYIEKNKKNIGNYSQKLLKPSSTALRSLSINIPIASNSKAMIPKSQIPGFSFKLCVPDTSCIDIDLYTINECSLYPKNSYSDTECPPTPPDYLLEDIQGPSEPIQSPNLKETGTQTDKKMTKTQDIILRRSQRLAQKFETKRKCIEYSCSAKKLKFN
jgi:hypothetical protein